MQTIWAFGHENILGIHPTTLMITKAKHVSPAGDCVVAVAADKAALDVNPQFKEALKKSNAKVTVTIEAGDLAQHIFAFGSPDLILSHDTDLVVRKSDFISDRTLAICADKAAIDLPRWFIEKLKDPKQQIKITFIVED
jgi:uncharacterized protein